MVGNGSWCEYMETGGRVGGAWESRGGVATWRGARGCWGWRKGSTLWFSFSERKGHYCVMEEGKNRCLGPSKGRPYPPLSSTEVSYLKQYYGPDNLALIKLLKELKRPLPVWLS
jgi:hypothetical protein